MNRRGLGLISMRERLRLVNGELSIQSTAGRGTIVLARVPLGHTEDFVGIAG
jgi:two-component system sensor histidine kinase DegS